MEIEVKIEETYTVVRTLKMKMNESVFEQLDFSDYDNDYTVDTIRTDLQIPGVQFLSASDLFDDFKETNVDFCEYQDKSTKIISK